MSNIPEFSVAEFSSSIKRLVEDAFGYVRIKGEISGFKQAASGHCYFSLKDETAVISAALFRNMANLVDFKIEEGLEVVASGKVTTYAGRSNYQIIVEKLEIAGVGAILEMIEKRRKKLESEGLFDQKHKKALPFFPKQIGVITSKTGAVIEDIKHRINDRCPLNLVLYPVAVQGKNAAGEIINAIKYFNNLALNQRPELIIIARGGGSIEDLMAFNDEDLIRAVFASEITIISGVGHETDITLIDYVSDVRAPTPSAAAEIATPLLADLRNNIEYFATKLQTIPGEIILLYHEKLQKIAKFIQSPKRIINEASDRLASYVKKFDLSLINAFESKNRDLLKVKFDNQNLLNKFEMLQQRIVFLDDKINDFVKQNFTNCQNNLDNLAKILQNSSHEQILKRGFALVKDQGNNLISSKSDLNFNDKISIQLYDGEVKAKIDK